MEFIWAGGNDGLRASPQPEFLIHIEASYSDNMGMELKVGIPDGGQKLLLAAWPRTQGRVYDEEKTHDATYMQCVFYCTIHRV